MLSGLDLFSGIGGISLALRPWVRTLAYVESDPYCQGGLHANMCAGRIDFADTWDDVTTFEPKPWAGEIDIITGGFPCQDISLAGSGAGLAGERSGLFSEIIRCAGVIRPAFIFLENVPAITGRGGWEVVGALAEIGYDARWAMLSAYDMGAPHLRERWWCLAHDTRDGRRAGRPGRLDSGGEGEREPAFQDELADATGERRGEAGKLRSGESAEWLAGGGEAVAHSEFIPRRARLRKEEQEGERWRRPSDCRNTLSNADKPGLEIGESQPSHNGEEQPSPFRTDWWTVEPNVGRVVDGIPFRVDRIRGLGNSVVPQCAREAFQRLIGL